MQQHIKEYPHPFYKDTVGLLKKINSQNMYYISEDPHMLEAVRLNINYNKYMIYFIAQQRPDLCYRKLKLTEYQMYNLFYQLFAIEKDNFLELCKSEEKNAKIDSIIKKLTMEDSKYILYVCFDKKADSNNNIDNALYFTKNSYDVGGVVLGIDSLRMLQHQRLDRLCSFLTSEKKDVKTVIAMMLDYRRTLRTLPWIERDRIMIFSGTTWQLLGTTYTNDVDLIIVANNKDRSYQDKFLRTFPQSFVDGHILLNDNKWHKKDVVLEYQKEWFTYILPNLSGAKDIFEMVCNPKHYCFYMGMRLLSIESLLQRSKARALPSTLADLIMIKKINNLEVKPKPCIPNMIINQGRVKVYYGTNLDKAYSYTQHLLKLWYQKSMSIDEIKKEVGKCTETSEIYAGKVPKDYDTENIKVFHTMIKKYLIKKFCTSCENLLDVGSGRLRDLEFWEDAHIKHVVAIEPSKSSIDKGVDRLKKRKSRTRVEIIHGQGDDKWQQGSGGKYGVLSKYKFDCITFHFTIHYMIKNLDTVLENLLAVTKQSSKIIILCMDGKYTKKKLQENSGQVEIRNKQEPIFAVYDLDRLNKSPNSLLKEILVYFKGTYGVQNGSIEYSFDYDMLIDKFAKNFKLLEKFHLLDVKIPERNLLNDLQKEVSKFFMGLVFERIT